MPILRFTAGEIVPYDGTFAIVGHFGEATDVALGLNKGERFPLITIAADFGSLWFVQMDEANQAAGTA